MIKKQRSDSTEADGRGDQKKAGPGTEAESFGPWLRRQREMREIDLREIADSSKISLRYLQAFEENRFDELPADVFAKGFLRHYARFVGIDQEEAVNFFAQARKEANLRQEEDEVTRVVRIRSSKSSSSRRSANRRFVLVILLAAGLLLFVIWQLSEWQQRQAIAEGEAPASLPAEAQPADGGGTDGTQAEPVTADPASGPATTEPAAIDPATGQPLAPPAGPAQPPVDPLAGPPPTGLPAGAPATPPPAVDPAQVPQQQVDAGDLIRVALDFQGQCWVEAVVDGKRQQSATRAQGESVVFSGNELIEIKLGDYRAVSLEVNGRSMPLKAEFQRGVTARLRFDLPYVAAATGVPLETLQAALAARKKAGAGAR
jgi:cytoskeleton protein RodZ